MGYFGVREGAQYGTLSETLNTRPFVTSVPLAVNSIEEYLRLLTRNGSFDLTYTLTVATGGSPELVVQFAGPDVELLVARHGELLYAVEHIGAKILGLEPEEHDRISFDAGGFKAVRDAELRASAEAAIARVRATGTAFAFPPMTSRERRMLHLALQGSGLPTASSGINPRRFVVLYPEGAISTSRASDDGSLTVTAERTEQLRNRFRRR